MIDIKKIQKIHIFILAAVFFPIKSVLAVCPVCTIAVGAGVGLAQYLGIDDAITGVWIGGLVISMAFWTHNWLSGKGKNVKYREIYLVLFYYLLVVAPLYWQGVIGHPFNKLCGVDKLLLGIITGSLGFWAGSELHLRLKEKNGDKVYFPFQKVVFGIAPLIVLSLMFYIISKC